MSPTDGDDGYAISYKVLERGTPVADCDGAGRTASANCVPCISNANCGGTTPVCDPLRTRLVAELAA